MRIVFILPTVSMGGGTRVIKIYAEALVRMGHLVTLISVPSPKFTLRQKLASLIRGTGWPSDASPPSHLDGSDLDHRIIDQTRPIVDHDVPEADVVIATWWMTAEWVNALQANKGAKVYFIQGHEVFPHLPIARCAATYRMPLHKIVVARWLQEMMATQYGDSVVDVVPNSVDRKQFFSIERGKQSVPTAGFLYSSLPFKGLDILLQALALARQHYSDMRVVCFGSEQPSRFLGDHTEFYLCPPQDRIREVYSRCDVWLTASRSEGFNLPAMEAMACRTPIIATRTGWPEQAVVSEKNGVLVDFDDPEAMALAIKRVFSLSDKGWRDMSANAYETTLFGSWESSAQMFEKALQHACFRSKLGQIGGKCSPPL